MTFHIHPIDVGGSSCPPVSTDSMTKPPQVVTTHGEWYVCVCDVYMYGGVYMYIHVNGSLSINCDFIFWFVQIRFHLRTKHYSPPQTLVEALFPNDPPQGNSLPTSRGRKKHRKVGVWSPMCGCGPLTSTCIFRTATCTYC